MRKRPTASSSNFQSNFYLAFWVLVKNQTVLGEMIRDMSLKVRNIQRAYNSVSCNSSRGFVLIT